MKKIKAGLIVLIVTVVVATVAMFIGFSIAAYMDDTRSEISR